MEDGKIYMGADSAGVADCDVRIRSDEKLFLNKNMLIGYTGSYRTGQLLRFSLKIPTQSNKNDYEYMCTSFIDSVSKILEEKKCATIENNEIRTDEFLVGYKGKLYRVENDLQVGIKLANYDACGSGENYALGSLYAMAEYDFTPEERVLKALETAHEFSCGVRPPFTMKKL
jgi:ATP-dependent protease HslVU (ClpYQ) peptidase subunit